MIEAAPDGGVTNNLDPPQCAARPGNGAADRLTGCMQQLHRLVSDRLMGQLQSELQGEVVSFTQMTAMYKVRAFAPISVTMLAEHLGVSLPATSQLIQELVRRGLMERTENPENRREKLLALSEKGQQFLNVKEHTMMGAYSEVFGEVSPETLRRAEDAITALIHEARALQARRSPDRLSVAAGPVPHEEPL
ncbi:MarR family transcriptional regulator [Deinococcus irradiatisoli]|uniref:MarR family transcriptional regulator n=1 Tax=Deinococcus irradiatisoli TaxID=2202254 RepID=A0A2Z3JS47_9DEIO|nr:MarR family transcriptional regulator [Deinococcus irradiatisoli]AWN23574.1 MarR family transcriptional regulator [Deinococcus irradiatisoli]